MKHLFMRAGKSPFFVADAYDTFDRNIIGNNNGNLIFAAAAHKLLSTTDTLVEPIGYSIHPRQADRVNAEGDGFILPLANAFRPSWEQQLKNVTAFIRRLKVPFVMLSGGAQSGIDGTFEHLKPMEASIKEFCSVVLDKSSHITVRGEVTAEYIRSLGFEDVLVIGCPSMTMNGPGHSVRSARYDDHARIAYNIESSKDIMSTLVSEVEHEYQSTYFPQDISTLEMMLWAIDRYPATRNGRLPLRSSHRQFSENRAKFMLDAYTWIDTMKHFDLSFGARIHGNIAAILAGTPAVVFAHDTRTLELAEYHEIPHFRPSEVDSVDNVEQVFEKADFGAFNRGHAQRFDKLVDFLSLNGFENIFEPNHATALRSYEDRLKRTDFYGAQGTVWAGTDDLTRSRLKRERTREIEASATIRALKVEVRRLKAMM